MPNTLRYTSGGDYDAANSQAIATDLVADLTHVYRLDSHGFYQITDVTDNVYSNLADAATNFAVGANNAGIYADFSTNIGAVMLNGGSRGDVLTGGLANDVLFGGDGDDVLNGGDGDDLMYGGAGADMFDGGEGYNIVSYATAGQGVYVNQFILDSQGEAAGDTFTNVQALIGSMHDDEFDVVNPYVIEGGAGADTIRNVAALLNGPETNVTASYEHSAAGVYIDLSGSTANTGGDAEGDILAGVSRVIGSRHNDTLIAGDVNSNLRGGGGEDTITGGAGDDTIAVTGRWAAIDGGDGFDRLFVREGGGSLNTIQPDSGTLINIEKVVLANNAVLDLSGQAAIDGSIKLNSRADGVDFVFGTNFDDRIIGGLGTDILLGGLGRDRLTGGLGSDIFAVAPGDAGDTITDFSGHNGDHDTLAFVGGPPPTFVEAFSASGAVEVRVKTVQDGLYLVLYDGDGDGNADASIRVRSTDALTADDIYNPGGSNSAHVSGLAQHPAFVEALQSHDIAGLI